MRKTYVVLIEMNGVTYHYIYRTLFSFTAVAIAVHRLAVLPSERIDKITVKRVDA
jgi:hypothetical protein